MSDRERSLSGEVQRLAHIHEITQLKARYCRAVDTKDWEGYRSLLTEDFYFESDGGIQKGRDQVVSFVSKAMASAQSVHHVHSPEIAITGPSTATAIWAMNDYVEFTGFGAPFVLRGYGHYTDEYVRTEDGWRLKRCVLSRLRVDTEGQVPGSVSALTENSA